MFTRCVHSCTPSASRRIRRTVTVRYPVMARLRRRTTNAFPVSSRTTSKLWWPRWRNWLKPFPNAPWKRNSNNSWPLMCKIRKVSFLSPNFSRKIILFPFSHHHWRNQLFVSVIVGLHFVYKRYAIHLRGFRETKRVCCCADVQDSCKNFSFVAVCLTMSIVHPFQDYSWDDQGYSVISQLCSHLTNVVDQKFHLTRNLTYYT